MITCILIIIFILIILLNKKKEFFKNKNLKIKNIKRPLNWNKLGFREKLKIYGRNLTSEHAIYVDKLKVKTLLKNIPKLYFAKVIKVLKNNNLNLNEFTTIKNYVVKSSHGWNDLIIVKNNKIIKMLSRNKKFDNNINNYNLWKNNSMKLFIKENEIQYKYIEPNIFIEEYLGDNLIDYKFYCINGQVEFIKIVRGRFNKICYIYLDRNLNKSKYVLKTNICENYNLTEFEKNKLNEMVKISENISSIFEFARIDLYLIKNKIYFGEITLTPMSSKVFIKPENYDLILGNKWI